MAKIAANTLSDMLETSRKRGDKAKMSKKHQTLAAEVAEVANNGRQAYRIARDRFLDGLVRVAATRKKDPSGSFSVWLLAFASSHAVEVGPLVIVVGWVVQLRDAHVEDDADHDADRCCNERLEDAEVGSYR